MKTTLQAKFELLKTATSKNIQNPQEMVQAQQTYTTVLLGHIVALHTKWAHLDKQIQIHCTYPHQQSDTVQLNALDYDLDIDGETNPEDHNTTHSTSHRSEHQSPTTHQDRQTTEPDNAQQQQAEHPSDYRPQLDDIPELETDEENWDEGQFDDAELLYNHNSTEESNRIHREYSAHFQK